MHNNHHHQNQNHGGTNRNLNQKQPKTSITIETDILNSAKKVAIGAGVQNQWSQIIDMGKCVLGIYASFMVMSVYQERVTRKPYGNDQYYNFPLFLVFVQCVLNSIVAYVKMNFFSTESRKSNVPIKFYAMASFAYLMASVCSNAALVYVNYPTQVLAKSCKSIPVMLLGVLIAKKSYSFSRYVSVLFLSLGISIFMLSRFSSGKSSNYNDNNTYGLVLLMLSLFSDGFTNAIQSMMQNRASKPTADEMMLYMNMFAVLFVGIALLISQQFLPAIAFCIENPEIISDISIFAICMAAGQIFIFWCIASFSPLVCSIVTTTRKFFTILFSVFWYGHEMGKYEWIGMFIVFVGLMYDIFSSLKVKKEPESKKK